MSAPEQRDRDLVQVIAKLRAELDDLRSTVVGRWGRIPTEPADSPPDGSTWIDQTTPALMGRANGATFSAAPSVRTGVILSDTQTIPTGTLTEVSWATEVSDPHNWHDAASAAVIVPATRAGRYAISFRGAWASDPVHAVASLLINASHVASAEHLAWYSWSNVLTISCLYLNAGDDLRFVVWHSAGANRDVAASAEIVWLGP